MNPTEAASAAPAPAPVPKPMPGKAGGYCPELGEAAPDRLFFAEYNYRGYGVCWKVEHDQAARAELRRLRIRPSDVTLHKPATWLPARRLGCDVYSGLVTVAAHRKLIAAGIVATLSLLD